MKTRKITLSIIALCSFITVNAQELTSLTIKNPSGGSSYQSFVPGFKNNKFDYEVLLSSTAEKTPEINASGSGKVKIEQAKSIKGTESERTATVSVEKDGKTATYTVLFTKTESLLAGILHEDKGSFFTGEGFYASDKISHGELYGDYSYRALSSVTFSPYLTSPAIKNGVGKISFWMTEDLADSDKTSELLVKVARDGENWKTIARFSAKDLKTYVWEKKEIEVNSESSETRVQFMISRSDSQRDIRFDDIVITPYE